MTTDILVKQPSVRERISNVVQYIDPRDKSVTKLGAKVIAFIIAKHVIFFAVFLILGGGILGTAVAFVVTVAVGLIGYSYGMKRPRKPSDAEPVTTA